MDYPSAFLGALASTRAFSLKALETLSAGQIKAIDTLFTSTNAFHIYNASSGDNRVRAGNQMNTVARLKVDQLILAIALQIQKDAKLAEETMQRDLEATGAGRQQGELATAAQCMGGLLRNKQNVLQSIGDPLPPSALVRQLENAKNPSENSILVSYTAAAASGKSGNVKASAASVQSMASVLHDTKNDKALFVAAFLNLMKKRKNQRKFLDRGGFQ